MLASYVLSRTLVPTLVMWFYRNVDHYGEERRRLSLRRCGCGPSRPSSRGFERGFARFRENYRDLLGACARPSRWLSPSLFLAFCVGSLLLIPQLGQDFFPSVDAGQFRLHLRARSGTRIEETAKLVDEVEAAIRKEIPPSETRGMLDNIGMPSSGISSELQQQRPDRHGRCRYPRLAQARATARRPNTSQRLRTRLNRQFPGTTFYFLPADIVSQTLELRPARALRHSDRRTRPGQEPEIAARLAEKIRQVPGAVDVRVQQPADLPKLRFADRPHQSGGDGPVGAGRGQLRAAQLERQRPGAAGYWLNPALRHSISGQRPRARTRAWIRLAALELDSRQRRPTRRRRRPDPGQCRDSSRGPMARRSSRITMSCRSSMCLAA